MKSRKKRKIKRIILPQSVKSQREDDQRSENSWIFFLFFLFFGIEGENFKAKSDRVCVRMLK